MTISSTIRIAGPYAGTGIQLAFTFAFKVFANTDMLVVQTNNTTGAVTVMNLTSDYTVLLNTDQNANPGGTITMIVAPAVGISLSITSQVPLLQPTDIANVGNFYPKAVTDAFDRACIQIQQQTALFGSTVHGVLGEQLTAMPPATARANSLLGFDALGQPTLMLAPTGSGTALAIDLANGSDPSKGVTLVANAASSVVLANNSDVTKGLAKIGYRTRTAWSAFNTMVGVSPEDFGAVGDAVTDDLTAVNSAIAEAISKRIPLVLNKTYAVNGVVVITGVNGMYIHGCGGGFRTLSNSAANVLEIRDCTDIKTSGDITIDAQAKVNITAAIKVWASATTCSLHELCFSPINTAAGWQFGDFSKPDALVSEIVVRGGYTYNCPQPFIVIGSQAVIEVSGYQTVAAGQGGLAGNLHIMATVYGGSICFNGGECQMPTVTTGYGFAVCPINSPGFAHTYGDITTNGVEIENASLMFLAFNPNAVPSVAAGSGGIRMDSCRGFHSFTSVSFQSQSDFSGQVIVSETNNFFRTSVNANYLSVMNGAGVVSISPMAFKTNWRYGLDAINGGVAIFPWQKIFEASNLSGATFAVGNTNMVFTSVPATAENSHFTPQYNVSNGVFTVPAGGLKNVTVLINFQNSQPNVGSAIQLMKNSVLFASCASSATYSFGRFEVGTLVAGDTINFRVLNAGSSFASAGGAQDRMVISASC